MKIYRCVLGCLLVFFIAIGVWYVVSCFGEQRSIEDGTLIRKQYERELDRKMEDFGGVAENGTDNNLYQG